MLDVCTVRSTGRIVVQLSVLRRVLTAMELQFRVVTTLVAKVPLTES